MSSMVERCPRCMGPVSGHCMHPQCKWLKCLNKAMVAGKPQVCGTIIDEERGEWVVGTTGERGEL